MQDKRRLPKASFERKVEWLIERPSLWKHLPEEAPYYAFRNAYGRLAVALKDAGLLARTTSAIDAGIERLVKEARRRVAVKEGLK